MPPIDETRMGLRPGRDRGTTDLGWLHSRHSFSFGDYQDPQNTGYRALRVLNDDRVEPGGGFTEHGHRNMEILTWVLEGALKHGDSLGHLRELRPGELQVMSAGRGIRHSELNASSTDPVHFLQIWIAPRTLDIEPRYDQKAFDPERRRNRWDTIASGRAEGSSMSKMRRGVPIHQDADMRVADLDAGASVPVDVPSGRFGYLHVATGIVQAGAARLEAGDAVTIQGPGECPVHAVESSQLLWFDLS